MQENNQITIEAAKLKEKVPEINFFFSHSEYRAKSFHENNSAKISKCEIRRKENR